MPDNIFPDQSGADFDIKYNQLKILPSDIKSRAFNNGEIGSGNISHPQTGGGGGDDTPIPPGNSGCKLVYVANISQSGTSLPTALVYENTIGPIIWTRVSTGIYQGVLTAAFPTNNTWLMINKDSILGVTDVEANFRWIDENTVEIRTFDYNTFVLADGILNITSIEIRTYCIATTGADCIAVGYESSSMPDAFVDIPYNFVLNLTGTGPFALGAITKPSWMTVNIVGSTMVFGGTPSSGDAGTGISVSVEITNCDAGTTTYSDTIDVIVLGEFIIYHTVENSTHSKIQIGYAAVGVKTGHIDWGDGTIESFSSSFSLILNHDYIDTASHPQVIYYDTNAEIFQFLDDFEGNNQHVTYFSHTDNFTNLTGGSSIQLTGVLDMNNCLPPAASHINHMTWIGHTDSTQITMSFSSLESFMRAIFVQGFPMLTTITNIPSFITTYYTIQQNPVLNSINAGGNMPAAVQQQLSTNKDGLVFGTLDLSVCNIFIFDQDFSVSQVNAFLIGLDANGLTGGNAYMPQIPAAPPSGAGATAKANLISKGWGITTD